MTTDTMSRRAWAFYEQVKQDLPDASDEELIDLAVGIDEGLTDAGCIDNPNEPLEPIIPVPQ
jgi:hypothetical protein